VAVALAAGVVACRTLPIEDYRDVAIGGTFTLDQIADKIATACKQRGWHVRLVAPGRMEATLVARSHMATVEITFDRTRYSIVYRDSENLMYDGTHIHKNYMRWIRTLNREIGLALSY